KRSRAELEAVADELEFLAPGIFARVEVSKKHRASDTTGWLFGDPRLVRKVKASGIPCISQKGLRDALGAAAQRLGIEAPLSDGKKGGMSLSKESWKEYAHADRFVDRWVALSHWSKLLGFFPLFRQGSVLRPRYALMKKTGRTSC